MSETNVRGPVLIIGSSNIDFVMEMSRLPKVGETMTDAHFIQTYGGKGANQAVAAAKAGYNAQFVTCVGDDIFAASMLESWSDVGRDVTHVIRESGIWSGTALVMIGEAGNNYLSVAPGANYRLDERYFPALRELVEHAGIVVLQCEIPKETITAVLKFAESFGTPVLWNFAPARMRFADDELRLARFLVANATEAAYLSGMEEVGLHNVASAAATIADIGIEAVIVTLGHEGVYVLSKSDGRHTGPFKVKAVDTTAAGDTFCGALAVATVEEMPLDDAVRFASAAAALSVTRLGAQPSCPTRDEIDEFLAANRS